MKKKNKIIIVLIFLIFLSVSFIISNIKVKKISHTPSYNNAENLYLIKATLEINDTAYKSEIKDKTTIYDFMSKLRDEGKIDFTEKNYVGIGKFIETINGTTGNTQKNWIYYVNGKKAEMGVSDYKINNGDIISWKYESNY